MDQFRELLASLNISVKIVEVGDYLVFIGSGEDNLKPFSRFETKNTEPESEEIEFEALSFLRV